MTHLGFGLSSGLDPKVRIIPQVIRKIPALVKYAGIQPRLVSGTWHREELGGDKKRGRAGTSVVSALLCPISMV